MKYLKYFESKFPGQSDDSVEDIKTLEEIFIDLNDAGYATQVLPSPIDLASGRKYPDIVIQIKDYEFKNHAYRRKSKKDRDKHLEKETVLRAIDYMESRGYHKISDHISWNNDSKRVFPHGFEIQDVITWGSNDPCEIDIRFTKKKST